MPDRKFSRNVHVRAGALGGWHEDQTARERHAHLRVKIREDGAGEVSRRLNFISNVANRNNNQKLHRIAREDQRWVAENFETRRRRSHLRE